MTVSHRSHAKAAAALVAVLALSGCAAPSYEAETAEQLRGDVHSIAASSAAGDWDAAVAGLDEMADRLDRAHSRGRMDDDRFEAIAAAMRLVRADLESAILVAESEAERQRLLDAQATLEQRLQELTEQQEPAGGNSGADPDDGPGDADGKPGKDPDPGKGKDRGGGKGNGKGGKG
jgi:hypothetical protein